MKNLVTLAVLALGLTGCAGATTIADTTPYTPKLVTAEQAETEVYIPNIKFVVPDQTTNPITPEPEHTHEEVSESVVPVVPEVAIPVTPVQPETVPVVPVVPETPVADNWAQAELDYTGFGHVVVDFGDTVALCGGSGGCGLVGGNYIVMNPMYASPTPDALHVLYHEVGHTTGISNECEAEYFAHSITGNTELWSYEHCKR